MQVYNIQGQTFIRPKDVRHPNPNIVMLFQGRLSKKIRAQHVPVDEKGKFLVPTSYIAEAEKVLDAQNGIFTVVDNQLVLKEKYVFLVDLHKTYQTSYRALTDLFKKHEIPILSLPEIFPTTLNYIELTDRAKAALRELSARQDTLRKKREGKTSIRELAAKFGMPEAELVALCEHHGICTHVIYKPFVLDADLEKVRALASNPRPQSHLLTLPEAAAEFGIPEDRLIVAVVMQDLPSSMVVTSTGHAKAVDPKDVRKWLGLAEPMPEAHLPLQQEVAPESHTAAEATEKPVGVRKWDLFKLVAQKTLTHTQNMLQDLLADLGSRWSKTPCAPQGSAHQEHTPHVCYRSTMAPYLVLQPESVLDTIKRLQYPTLCDIKDHHPGLGRSRLCQFLQQLQKEGRIVAHGANKTHYVASEQVPEFWEWIYNTIETTLGRREKPMHFRDLQSETRLDHALLREALSKMVQHHRLRRIDDPGPIPTMYALPSRATLVVENGTGWTYLQGYLQKHRIITRSQVVKDLGFTMDEAEALLMHYVHKNQLKPEMGLIPKYSLHVPTAQNTVDLHLMRNGPTPSTG